MKVRECSSRDTECGGERLRGDLVPGSTNSNQAKGVIRAGTIEAKVDDTVDEHGSRAGNRVATAAMGNGFTTDSVLLGVKGEGRVSGGTDVCSGFVGGNPFDPVYKGEIQCRMLGCDLQAWDDLGQPVIGEVGEMVITQPMPSMPVFFWGDDDNKRYKASYFEMYPNVWRHGDWIQSFG